MEQSGEERWTAFAAGFHARIFHVLEKARESTANDPDCFSRWRESSTKCGPDMFSWRTHLILFAGESKPFSGPWPRWGMIQDGVFCPLPPLVRLTNAKDGGGYLPTPIAHDAKQCVTAATMARSTLDLSVFVALYPTPTAGSGCGGSYAYHKFEKMDLPEEDKRSLMSGGGRLPESRLGRVADGLASRLDGPGESAPVFWTADEWGIPRIVPQCNNRRKRLKTIGNGQVPACAAASFLILMEMFQPQRKEL